jgi:hypothetical protein
MTSSRMQPWPLSIQSMSRCCSIMETPLQSKTHQGRDLSFDLLQCVREANDMKDKGNNNKVAIFTYVIAETDTEKHFAVPDIMNFASYHAAIMSVYAEQNGYLYKFITSDMPEGRPDRLEPADVRWNKVKLLIDALDPTSGWAKDMEYIAWIDADAIVLDLGLKLENIMTDQYPEADFVASADIRQGYINSGMLLLRNTLWTREFLQRWWTVADRSNICDQDAFDELYHLYAVESNQNNNKQYDFNKKIVVLPRDALNTDPPATLKLLPHNQVLHLMGESTSYRTAIFGKAFHSICEARTGGILPAQLGLHRKLLHDNALRIYRDETQTKITESTNIVQTLISSEDEGRVGSNDAASLASPAAHGTDSIITELRSDEELEVDMNAIILAPYNFERIGRASHHLCDLLQANGDDDAMKEAYDVRVQVLALVFQWLERGHATLRALKTKINLHDLNIKYNARKMDITNALLQLLKRAAEAGNDVFGAAKHVDQKRDAASKTFKVLDELYNRVDTISKLVPAHMQALMHQNMAYMEYELAMAIPVPLSDTLNNEEEINMNDIISNNRKNIKKSMKREEHLEAALSQATHSVQIFSTHFGRTSDRSIRGEHLHSLQILAAIYCADGKIRDFSQGTKIWREAVVLGDQNMQNVRLGASLDLYGSIAHNAAICHLQAGYIDEALKLAYDAMNAREEFSVQQGLPIDKSNNNDLSQSNYLLHMSRELVNTIEREANKLNINPKDIQINDNKLHSISDFDSDEWEECEEGEEGCEAFYVENTADENNHSIHSTSPSMVDAESIDVSVGFKELKGVKHTSQGLDHTLDSIELFMKNLGDDASGSTLRNTQKKTASADSTFTSIMDFHSDDWEECEEGEEGCEAFTVEDYDEEDKAGSQSIDSTLLDMDAAAPTTTTAKEKEELQEAQLLWATQTAAFQ